MPKILLSQNADKALHTIYKKSLTCNSSSNHYKAFFINSVFHNSDDTNLMPSLIELSKHRMIRFFSDKRIMLNYNAIPYIEKQIKNGFIDFET